MKFPLDSIIDTKKKKAGVVVLCIVLIATVALGTRSDDRAPLWENSFYQSVSYDTDKKLLSFTIPETIPEGYRFYLHVSGRIFMDGSDGMSFHAFDEESLTCSWKAGKTYTYSVNSNGLDYCLLSYGLVDHNGNAQEPLHEIKILPAGTKTISPDQ